MERFRKHQIPVLVATDLAARGIDVQQISHIVNYDLPQDISVYVHRIGRTARMGATGRAITFATREQGGELTQIEQLINKQISKLDVEGFESTPPPRGEMAHEPTSGRRPYSIPESFQATAPKAPSTTAPVPASPSPNLGGKFPLSRRRRR